jgi:hypothetical protein
MQSHADAVKELREFCAQHAAVTSTRLCNPKIGYGQWKTISCTTQERFVNWRNTLPNLNQISCRWICIQNHCVLYNIALSIAWRFYLIKLNDITYLMIMDNCAKWSLYDKPWKVYLFVWRDVAKPLPLKRVCVWWSRGREEGSSDQIIWIRWSQSGVLSQMCHFSKMEKIQILNPTYSYLYHFIAQKYITNLKI